jgi:hypothetical protein
MKFRLLDKAGKETVHEAVMPRTKAPTVVGWGERSFVLNDYADATAIYVEADVFKIAGFR